MLQPPCLLSLASPFGKVCRHEHHLQPRVAQSPVSLEHRRRKSRFQNGVWQPLLFPSAPASETENRHCCGCFPCVALTSLKRQPQRDVFSVKKHLLFRLLLDISVDELRSLLQSSNADFRYRLVTLELATAYESFLV